MDVGVGGGGGQQFWLASATVCKVEARWHLPRIFTSAKRSCVEFAWIILASTRAWVGAVCASNMALNSNLIEVEVELDFEQLELDVEVDVFFENEDEVELEV